MDDFAMGGCSGRFLREATAKKPNLLASGLPKDFGQTIFPAENPMAITTKNKFPAEKAGTKYSEFKNTKRTPPGKARAERAAKPAGSAPAPAQAPNQPER
jgi:hypothetical protein